MDARISRKIEKTIRTMTDAMAVALTDLMQEELTRELCESCEYGYGEPTEHCKVCSNNYISMWRERND